MSKKFLEILNGNSNGPFKRYSNTLNDVEPNIAWYMSAGNDFRPFLFLSNQYIKKQSNTILNEKKFVEPNIFLFTDYNSLLIDNLFPPDVVKNFNDSPILFEYSDLSGYLLFEDKRTSIRLKKIEFLPRIESKIHRQIVHFPEHNKKSNNIIYAELEVCSKTLGVYEVRLLYLNLENEYFASKAIEYNASLSHVIHVRYGAAFGGAYASGIWITKILSALKTRYLITDRYLKYQSGDYAALKIYPNLNEIDTKCKLRRFHMVDGKSWSRHGIVNFYSCDFIF